MSSPHPEPTLVRSASDVNRLLAHRTTPQRGATAVVILALGGIFMDAYDFSSLAFGITQVKREFGLDGLMTGVVNAAIMVGAVVGALAGGALVDRFGRYRLFMADMVFFVVAAIGCALAPDVWWLVAFRFIMGIGVGLDLPVAMAFLAEFSSLRGRGNRSERVNAWSAAWYAATVAGYVVVLVLYLTLPAGMEGLLWRFVVGFGAVPALVVLLVRRRYMAESPQWLANQGDLTGAVDVLRTSYGIEARVAPDAVVRPTRTERRRSFARLFTPRYRLRTLAGLCVSVFSTLAYSAITYGTPLIISELFGRGQLITIVSSLLIYLVFGVGGGLIAVATVTRLGSRRLCLTGFALQAVALVTLAVIGVPQGLLVWLALAMLALFTVAQGFGPGAQLMSYATLSYPTSLRGVGVGVNEGTKRVFAIVSLVAFPMLLSTLHQGVFWVFAIFPVLGVLALVLIRFEPHGLDTDAEEEADEAQREAASVIA